MNIMGPMNQDAPCPEEAIELYAKRLKVCGHPVRLKLLCLIHTNGEPCVTNLWTCLGQSQPVISQHLAILKDSGVVDSTVSGNKRIYTISDPFIQALITRMIKENDAIGAKFGS